MSEPFPEPQQPEIEAVIDQAEIITDNAAFLGAIAQQITPGSILQALSDMHTKKTT
ncbi:MAG TPA: hypothetical protein VF575_01580 [Candidatus Saccharimonadales bacterium]|jgi:hypothetical protein